jgi:hypothetical protein
MSPRSDQLRSALFLGAFSVALILTQSGCPQGAELENADAWAGRFGTGGTGAGATGPTGGSGMTGPVLDFATVVCPPALDNATTADPASVDFLNSTCAKNFCHGKNFVVGLDLRPDSGFASRLLDVSALYGGIPCPDDITMECIPAGCPTAGTAKLIDSGDATASWILKKSKNQQGDCGDFMPTGTTMLSADQDACITAIVTAASALK